MQGSGGTAVLYKLIEIFISALILIPVFCFLNRSVFRNMGRSVLYFIFAVYLSAVYLFVGMPTLQFIRFELSLTLVPFLPMIGDFKNTMLNILLFVPLGMMLPYIWKEYRTLKTTLMFGFGMSLSIELLQILTYRATDINDIIANTFGAVLGYLLFSTLYRIFPVFTKSQGKKRDLPAILLSVFLAMFFIQPYLANLYYKIA